MPLEKGKISGKQLTVLYITTIVASAVVFLPGVVAAKAQQDAWISSIIAAITGFFLALLVLRLHSRFPEQNVIQYSRTILGKWPGLITGAGFAWFFIHINAVIIREFGAFLATVLPETPPVVFMALIVLLSAYYVRNGLEVCCRIAEFYFPIFVLQVVVIVLLVVKEVRWQLFEPILGAGWGPVIEGIFPPVMWFGEVITMSMILPYLHDKSQAARSLFLGVLLAGILFFLASFFTIGVFGGDLTANLNFPVFELARTISIAQFLERVDAVLMSFWVAGGVIKITTFNYCAVLGTAQLLNLSDYKPIILPLAVIQVFMALTGWENVGQLKYFINDIIAPYSLILFEGGIPLMLLVIARIRRLGVTK
ncbi:MAG: hypothetical protein CVU89_15865 [Firmicutes bacterium HGW-Firmicutes-14]|nr:MAG: hypothetical protein CVU89_15865 [Firmicutes bacterium HGW-Firmicutes-14]